MANAARVVSTPRPARPPAERQRFAGFARRWDFLAVPLLMLISLPLAWVSPHCVIAVRQPGSFDDHWVLDAVWKTTHGIYFGRDAAFLYGPLAHWMLGAPARLAGLSMASIYTSYSTLLLWCTFLCVWGTLLLLLPEQPAWKRFLAVLLLVVFWAPWDGRTAVGIFLFALFLRGWYAMTGGRVNPAAFGCGSALLTTAAFWYSADTGVYSVAAWFIAWAGVAWEGRRELQRFRAYAIAAAAFAASFVVLIPIVNALIAGPLDFRFWRLSLALVAVHRWNEPAALSPAGAMHLLLPFAIGSAVFLLRRFVPGDRSAVITARTGFLLGAFLFAVLSMQTGLVRSDYNHIVFGVFPMVFFAAAILFSFRSRIASAIAALAAVACSFAFAEPAAIFRPSSIHYRLARMRHPITSCPSGLGAVDGVCFPGDFAQTLDMGVAYLQQHSRENERVLIFPYQYMFAVAARREVASPVEQSFLANGAYLSQFDLAGMERAGAPVGLYFPDAGPGELTSPTLSLPIDGISNFTRTPDEWFWILRHYRADRELAPGILGLVRDDSRASRISMHEMPLAIASRSYPIAQRETAIDLGAPEWPAGGADFLRLRLKIRYNLLWKLRKPERLQLEIRRADGSRSLQPFVLEPNVATDLWFYPWNESDLPRYFDADESRWRSSYRPAITGLRLMVTPLDWFSQKPEAIAVESAEAVRFSAQP
ncbi:MAG TPA: hypothetical protein VL240_00605 [Candidatus Binatia bacterium]|nr:hypothetical protein [Candidatus Binatia bacterium]